MALELNMEKKIPTAEILPGTGICPGRNEKSKLSLCLILQLL